MILMHSEKLKRKPLFVALSECEESRGRSSYGGPLAKWGSSGASGLRAPLRANQVK